MESSGVKGGKSGTTGKEVWNVVILSLSFTSVFTAYLAIQNLQSSLNQEEGLGIISLSCLYAFIILSSIMAPTILKHVGIKISLIVSWVSHCLYTLSNFYPTFWTLIPTSVLLGLISGPMWTSQSVYISTNAYLLAERTNKDPMPILSRMNGIFFTLYELTQITGNLLSSLVLKEGLGNETTTDNSSLTCGADDCPLSVNATSIKEPESKVVYILLSVFLVFDILGLILTAVFLQAPPKTEWSERSSTKESLLACVSALGDINLVLLVPFIAIMAMEQAVLWTDFTKSFISCPVGIGMVGFIMATYGGTTTLSALITSRISKYTGRHILFALAAIINGSLFVSMLVWRPDKHHLPYLFVMVVFWGLAEGIWQTQSNAVIALFFPDKKEPAFANYHCWKASSFTVYFVISNFLCVHTKLVLVLVLLCIGMILYAVVEIRVYRRNKEN
ncbi:hypothetical protein FSP39_015016 [Pinctada imbricata]|uniref:Uncharacterized protein n=1 Tax=Pinctada imbricata TaxID=66713 RepID=A0AA88Y7X2_PINIB|nr:hypothetical protein FSP39_015016 [Pinctada imbricata]